MTKQEVFQCDGCFEVKHFPMESRFTLKVQTYTKSEADIDFDLCKQCYDKLMDFLCKLREGKIK